MVSATRAVSFILLFLLLCMYVFAIIFVAQIGDPEAPEKFYEQTYWERDDQPTAIELFGTIGDSMMTLFTRGMLADNLAETLHAIKDYGGNGTDDVVCDSPRNMTTGIQEPCSRTGGSLILMWVFIVFMIISAFCLLNMLIGVLYEVVTDSAAQESESTQISDLRQCLSQAFRMIDESKDGLITPAEWEKMKLNQKVCDSMKDLGVEEEHMAERLDQMSESLFGGFEDEDESGEAEDSGQLRHGESRDSNRHGLTFEQFIAKVVEIRPDSPASALDIEILRVRVEREEKNFNARLDYIEQALASASPAPAGDIASKSALKEATVASKPDPSAAWLRDVPTEVLFAVLNSRAPPTPGLLAEK